MNPQHRLTDRPHSLAPELTQLLEKLDLRLHLRLSWLAQAGRSEDEESGARADWNPRRDNPEEEAAWQADQPLAQAAFARLAELAEGGEAGRFDDLVRIFGLDPSERDLLAACLAVALEPGYGRVFACLEEGLPLGFVTETLVARLYGYGHRPLLGSESPLLRWRLLSVSDTAGRDCFRCDGHIRNWLLGAEQLDPVLVGRARIVETFPVPAQWPVAHIADMITARMQSPEPQRLRVIVCGRPGSGRHTFAACVAEHLGVMLLAIEAEGLSGAGLETVFVAAQRQAFLDRTCLAWSGDSLDHWQWPQTVAGFHVQFVIRENEKVIPTAAGYLDEYVALPALSLAERRKLWDFLVPRCAEWSAEEFEALVTRNQVTPGELVTLGRRDPADLAEAATWLRGQAREGLGELATRLDCPFTWEDLVLPDMLAVHLEDFLYEAAERSVWWEQPEAARLFPQGKGLLALFSGTPGTGKTMTAQVLAAQLGLDLYRIDLSSVVSKYVGETSQNLDRILSLARHRNCVLFFDEADALFGRRTEIKDAHDRYANTDTNYLLQAIESYPGVALLATNKKGNIDVGFLRRLRYVLEFPKPDNASRLRIWHKVVGELAGGERLHALAPLLEGLAERLDLTGAQIKFSVLSALFNSRRCCQPLSLDHLLRGLERELMKESRGISRRVQEELAVYAR